MERLTIKGENEINLKKMTKYDAYREEDFTAACPTACSRHHECKNCPVQEAFDRLADYEDTGLTPEQIREIDKAYTEQAKELAELKKQGWIPVEERLPKDDSYILLSFDNFNLPCIGRYEVDADGGGAFYEGDDEKPLIKFGLFVNAWQPMLKPYREEDNETVN